MGAGRGSIKDLIACGMVAFKVMANLRKRSTKTTLTTC
jgi:hypothetical protein